MKLKNKVAIVTGSGRGIGKGIAEELAKEGAKVLMTDIIIENLKSAYDEIKSTGAEVSWVKTDISSEDEINNLVNTAVKKYGTVDILVNNAAIAYPTNLVDTTNDQWNDTLNINLTGTFKCIRAVLPIMINKKFGRIINISSILGKEGRELLSAYCASKFGVIGLSEALAREVKQYNININVICPDRVDTEMVRNLVKGEDYSKFLTPADIGRIAVFLSSDDTSKITGIAIDALANFGGPVL